MLYTITNKGFKNVTTQGGKDYTFTTLRVSEDPSKELSAFVDKSHDDLKVGQQVELTIKEGKFEGTWEFVLDNSLNGRMYRMLLKMEDMALDIAAIKVALQIQDVPRPPKVRAHQTDSQREVRAEAAANTAKDLEEVDTSSLPF